MGLRCTLESLAKSRAVSTTGRRQQPCRSKTEPKKLSLCTQGLLKTSCTFFLAISAERSQPHPFYISVCSYGHLAVCRGVMYQCLGHEVNQEAFYLDTAFMPTCTAAPLLHEALDDISYPLLHSLAVPMHS